MQLHRLLLFGILATVIASNLPHIAEGKSQSNTPPYRHPFITISHQVATPNGYVPAQIRQAYGITALNHTGSGSVVAVVDAFHNGTLATDLKQFSAYFNLPSLHGTQPGDTCSIAHGPHPCLEQLSSRTSTNDSGWSVEGDLDAEWAHAIAPGADLLFVEANDSSVDSLMTAVRTAVSHHPTSLSMSWGGKEFSKETSYDSIFNSTTTWFTAASGDTGTGVSFPASAPSVLAVGGTTLTLTDLGARKSEHAWTGSGGGVSKYESRPRYQPTSWLKIGRTKRLVPDVAFNANPSTGYAVYASSEHGWVTVGGTSAAAPQWAALLALTKTTPTTSKLYTLAGRAKDIYFIDISSGKNGSCRIFCTAKKGFDSVTGLGSPIANTLIPAL